MDIRETLFKMQCGDRGPESVRRIGKAKRMKGLVLQDEPRRRRRRETPSTNGLFRGRPNKAKPPVLDRKDEEVPADPVVFKRKPEYHAQSKIQAGIHKGVFKELFDRPGKRNIRTT